MEKEIGRGIVLSWSRYNFLLLLFAAAVQYCVLKKMFPVIEKCSNKIYTMLYIRKIYMYHIVLKIRALMPLCTSSWID